MPATQRKRSLQLFRKMKFLKGAVTPNASSNNSVTADESIIDIDKMMLHTLDCLGALQSVLGSYNDRAKSTVFWGAVTTIAEICMDLISGKMETRHPGASHLLRAFPNEAKATDGRGWLPLHWAAVIDDMDVNVVREIARADPLAIVKGFNQPISANPGHLIAAVRNPNMEVVRCLYNFHPRMASSKDNDGDLPLHYAARYSDSIEMIQFLLQANPCATRVQGDGLLVPLQCAIRHDNNKFRYKLVECLLNTDPQSAQMINSDGDTALHNAVDQVIMVFQNFYFLLINAYFYV